jgi:hypothetical protein
MPTKKPEPDDWSLIFRSVGPGPPVAVRVRRLLKFAWRALGLRCVGYGAGQPELRDKERGFRVEGRREET